MLNINFIIISYLHNQVPLFILYPPPQVRRRRPLAAGSRFYSRLPFGEGTGPVFSAVEIISLFALLSC